MTQPDAYRELIYSLGRATSAKQIRRLYSLISERVGSSMSDMGILQQLSHSIAVFPKPVISSRAWPTAATPT